MAISLFDQIMYFSPFKILQIFMLSKKQIQCNKTKNFLFSTLAVKQRHDTFTQKSIIHRLKIKHACSKEKKMNEMPMLTSYTEPLSQKKSTKTQEIFQISRISTNNNFFNKKSSDEQLVNKQHSHLIGLCEAGQQFRLKNRRKCGTSYFIKKYSFLKNKLLGDRIQSPKLSKKKLISFANEQQCEFIKIAHSKELHEIINVRQHKKSKSRNLFSHQRSQFILKNYSHFRPCTQMKYDHESNYRTLDAKCGKTKPDEYLRPWSGIQKVEDMEKQALQNHDNSLIS